VRTLGPDPHFLPLLIVLAAQPPAVDNGEVQAVIDRAAARHGNCAGPRSGWPSVTTRTARPLTSWRFALAAIDGAFLA